jgi:hypothetical protein
MDPIRTLVLTRNHTVVLDPDLVASASTRPIRDVDVDRFEAELARLGFVMSLDLAITVRRLPHPALQELRTWISQTLAARRPPTPSAQACPWCGKTGAVGALDPCRHLVCRACWDAAHFAACPICHRRGILGTCSGALAVLQLAIDPSATARAYLERLLARRTPLSSDERGELEALIDALGPRGASLLPARIPLRATMAIALARLWLVAPDRARMAAATAGHLATSSDVLRVAVVLMGGDPELAPPLRLRSLPRGMRRAILEALDRVPVDVAEIAKYRGVWQRAGEKLHPSELAASLPNAARVFAIARGHERAARWAAPVEHALAAGDAVTAITRLAERPRELIKRLRQVTRAARTPEASARLDAVLGELLARAGKLRLYPRALLDRALPREMWEAAAIHGAARANLIYVRERDGSFTIYRRRDGEPPRERLRRLLAGSADSFRLLAVPTADAPTLAILATADLPLPAGSAEPMLDELFAGIS